MVRPQSKCPFCKPRICGNDHCDYTIDYKNCWRFKMLDYLKDVFSKRSLLVNILSVVVFILPLFIYATAQGLELDLVVIAGPFVYGIFFEKAKRFLDKKVFSRFLDKE